MAEAGTVEGGTVGSLKAIAARLVLISGLFVGACDAADPHAFSAMPVPHANNAVASASVDGQVRFYSFNGLRSGKGFQDTSRMAFEFDTATDHWRRLPDLPVAKGRLASVAVGLAARVYVFGGYRVAEDGSEVSTPEVFAFDPAARRFERLADMPTPVDDSVGLAYADRYIYLVSGWHDDGNVALVQVYDTRQDRWFRATDWPGVPVFGHAGGIVGNRLVIADGVAVLGTDDAGRRRFGLVDQVWLGEINPQDPAVIDWTRRPPHPGQPLYRMAAAGLADRGEIVFTGGSPNAYNYNGIGYNGEPSPPSPRLFAFDLASESWSTYPDKPVASMDHRGLVRDRDGRLYTIGGMLAGQRVTGQILPVPLPPP